MQPNIMDEIVVSSNSPDVAPAWVMVTGLFPPLPEVELLHKGS